MVDERCANCGNDAAGTFELLLRSRNHEEVPLCEVCHEAIVAEMEDEGP